MGHHTTRRTLTGLTAALALTALPACGLIDSSPDMALLDNYSDRSVTLTITDADIPPQVFDTGGGVIRDKDRTGIADGECRGTGYTLTDTLTEQQLTTSDTPLCSDISLRVHDDGTITEHDDHNTLNTFTPTPVPGDP